jgi:lipoprotein NlpD
LVVCLLFGGCAATGGEAPQRYVVRPQDTLYSIAWRHNLDYRDLARWNNIGPDFRIAVGQNLRLGPGPGRVAGTARSAASAPRTARAAAPSAATRTQGAALKWVWPTDAAGGSVAVTGGGILLSGRVGQDVRAASAGRVVYTGSGLRGYGNLIIIKHGESLLSAYAHNREITVREGQDVAAGQVIARMGEDGHPPGAPDQVGELYFEIRLNGKPIDPMPFLESGNPNAG